MLREKIAVLSIVFSLLSLIILPLQTYGQNSESSPKIEKAALTGISNITNLSAKLFLTSETGDSGIKASLDRIEKERYKSSYSRKGALSSKAKTGIFIGIGAAAAVAVIIILVSGKDRNSEDDRLRCLIPEGCSNQ